MEFTQINNERKIKIIDVFEKMIMYANYLQQF